MYQCLGLGTEETGGCGEDWWHPECLVGLPRGWHQSSKKEKTETPEKGGKEQISDDLVASKLGNTHDEEHELNPLPPGFPDDEEWEALLCYKCVDSNPWIKRYANTTWFTPLFYKQIVGDLRQSEATEGATKFVLEKADVPSEQTTVIQKKRRASNEDAETRDFKRTKSEDASVGSAEAATNTTKCRHDGLSQPPLGSFSLFMKEDFRDHLCHCPSCFPRLIAHPQLREEEDTYEPLLSEDGTEGTNGRGSQGTGSLLDRGEAALSNIDRVQAIEGVMVYNHLRDKVKEFLKPFAESGKVVSADDIKGYFEKLRGDDQAIKEANGKAQASAGNGDGSSGDDNGGNRREQSGKSTFTPFLISSGFWSSLLGVCID